MSSPYRAITCWGRGGYDRRRDINIGMNGVSLKVDSEGFWVASEVPLQVVSSSAGGDLEETSHILGAGVPADPEQREYALRRPRAFVRERARFMP